MGAKPVSSSAGSMRGAACGFCGRIGVLVAMGSRLSGRAAEAMTANEDAAPLAVGKRETAGPSPADGQGFPARASACRDTIAAIYSVGFSSVLRRGGPM